MTAPDSETAGDGRTTENSGEEPPTEASRRTMLWAAGVAMATPRTLDGTRLASDEVPPARQASAQTTTTATATGYGEGGYGAGGYGGTQSDGTGLSRFDTDPQNNKIDFTEVLTAISAFNQGKEVGGKRVTFSEVLQLIGKFNQNEPV